MYFRVLRDFGRSAFSQSLLWSKMGPRTTKHPCSIGSWQTCRWRTSLESPWTGGWSLELRSPVHRTGFTRNCASFPSNWNRSGMDPNAAESLAESANSPHLGPRTLWILALSYITLFPARERSSVYLYGIPCRFRVLLRRAYIIAHKVHRRQPTVLLI